MALNALALNALALNGLALDGLALNRLDLLCRYLVWLLLMGPFCSDRVVFFHSRTHNISNIISLISSHFSIYQDRANRVEKKLSETNCPYSVGGMMRVS